MSKHTLTRLGDVAKLVWRREQVHPDAKFPLVGVRLWGHGAYIRETIFGSQTKYTTVNRVETGDIIVNKIWARNGSISVVDDQVSGAFGSSEFPVFVLDETKALPRWFYWFSRSPQLWRQCDTLSRGTSGQNRLQPEQFLEVLFPLPTLEKQKEMVAQFDKVADMLTAHNASRASTSEDLKSTLSAVFEETVSKAPRRKMKDVAPLLRRPVQVDMDSSYPELGVRSFGRGTFHKPSLNGVDVGSKRLFRIQESDLVFNVVFAWEGAVAVAKPVDDGRVGSHRFLTCVCDQEVLSTDFLNFYFQTPDGLRQLGEASPGGAGRNRTLGIRALGEIQVPVPAIEAQGSFNELQAKAEEIRSTMLKANNEADALLASLLHEVFGQS